MRKPRAQENHVGGYDLLVERDAGNEVLILTGKNSKRFWKQMKELSEQVLELHNKK